MLFKDVKILNCLVDSKGGKNVIVANIALISETNTYYKNVVIYPYDILYISNSRYKFLKQKNEK